MTHDTAILIKQRIYFSPLSVRDNGLSLLFSDLAQDVGIPPLPDVRMTLDAVPKRCLAQRLCDSALAEGELYIVDAAAVRFHDFPALLPHLLRHDTDTDRLEVIKFGVQLDPLEEGNREARAAAGLRRQHPVRRRDADALRQRLHTLPDRDDERALDGGAVDPFPLDVLHLQPPVICRLQEITRQHAVLVRADPLAPFPAQLPAVRVLDNLQLVLLVLVKVLLERVRGQTYGLGDERGESYGYAPHERHVLRVRLAEAGTRRLRGPLVRC